MQWYQRDISPGGGSFPFRCSWVNYTPAVTGDEIFAGRMQDFLEIEYLRNSAVHGSRPKNAETQNFIENQEEFITLFEKGINIYHALKIQ